MVARPVRSLLIVVSLVSTCTELAAQPLPKGAIRRIGTPGAKMGGYPHAVVTVSAEGELTEGGEANQVAVSADGKLQAIATDKHFVRLTSINAEQGVRDLKGHTAYVTTVAFSPDCGTLASGSNDRTLRLWDVATGEMRHVCTGHDDQVCGLAFAPDGKTIASASWDGTVRLWDVGTGKELRRCEGHRYEAIGVAFAPDGATLASGGTDGTVRIWDAATAGELRRWTVHESGVRGLAFSKDGKGIFSVDGHHRVQLWNVSDAQMLRAAEASKQPEGIDTAYCASFAPDGKTVALGHTDGTIRLCDIATGKELRVVGRHPGIIWSVAFSPDGKTLASSARRHGVVRLWDVETGNMIRSYAGHGGGVSGVRFTNDGTQLVAAGGTFEPSIIVYAVASGKELWRLKGHTDYVGAIALAPVGNTLASVAWDETVRVWDLAMGKEVRRWTGPPSSFGRVAFAADGAALLVNGPTGELRLHDVATGRERRRFSSVTRWLTTSADGRTLAGTTSRLSIELVEVSTDTRRRQFNAGRAGNWAAFSCDGRLLLTDALTDAALLWDLTGGANGSLAEPERGNAWRDLASADVGRAYDAHWNLVLSPKMSLPLLREQLRPAALVNGALMAQCLADLDDDDFAVRQKATQVLENAGEGARAVLEKAMTQALPIELKRRAESLLARLDASPPVPERLRELRALEVLEAVQTPEARQIVEALTKGAPDARLTREAKATLERMRRR